jgi:hypothetical protein
MPQFLLEGLIGVTYGDWLTLPCCYFLLASLLLLVYLQLLGILLLLSPALAVVSKNLTFKTEGL